MDVLVIGAGPAGIACAYYLEKAGLSYKVVDKAEVIASTWDSLYPSLKLNTTRFFSHLPDKKFPLHYGFFPTGKQYHHYLEEYVKDHQFNIHLGVTVYNVQPEGDGWRVESSEGSEWFPAVISASGRFNAPIMPNIPGDFSGEIIHASSYVNGEGFAGKRVMVVGNGPSGMDISVDISQYAQTPVYLSQRTGVILSPIYPLGLPKHLWVIIGEYLPKFIADPLIKFVSNIRYSDKAHEGIKMPAPGTMSSAARGTRGRGLIDAVQAGRVKSVDGPQCFDGDTVILNDGSRLAVDVIIMATGYKPVLYQYVDLSTAEQNEHGWPKRVDEPDDVYWQGGREVKNYPGLYLVGVYYQGKGAMYNFNIEAEAAAQEIQERLKQIKTAEH